MNFLNDKDFWSYRAATSGKMLPDSFEVLKKEIQQVKLDNDKARQDAIAEDSKEKTSSALLKNTLVGSGVGAAIGGTVGLLKGKNMKDRAKEAFKYALVGGGLGGIGGALLAPKVEGTTSIKDKTINEIVGLDKDEKLDDEMYKELYHRGEEIKAAEDVNKLLEDNNKTRGKAKALRALMRESSKYRDPYLKEGIAREYLDPSLAPAIRKLSNPRPNESITESVAKKLAGWWPAERDKSRENEDAKLLKEYGLLDKSSSNFALVNDDGTLTEQAKTGLIGAGVGAGMGLLADSIFQRKKNKKLTQSLATILGGAAIGGLGGYYSDSVRGAVSSGVDSGREKAKEVRDYAIDIKEKAQKMYEDKRVSDAEAEIDNSKIAIERNQIGDVKRSIDPETTGKIATSQAVSQARAEINPKNAINESVDKKALKTHGKINDRLEQLRIKAADHDDRISFLDKILGEKSFEESNKVKHTDYKRALDKAESGQELSDEEINTIALGDLAGFID